MKKLLVVIDYQNDFVNGALPCGKAAEEIESAICQKIQEYKENGDLIIYTLDTHDAQTYPQSAEGKHFPLHCVTNTQGWQLYGGVQKLSIGAPIVCKGSFGSVQLAERIAMLWGSGEVHSAEFVGVATNICVLHNVILAYNRVPDLPLMVDAACCASFDPALHRQALEMMKGFGVDVKNL